MPTFEHIQPADWKALKDTGEHTLLDVRTPGEVSEIRIPGALHIDINSPTFTNEVSELNKDTNYLVYCRSGARSGRAMDMMQGMGFKSVNNLVGGILGWDQMNYEVERG